jgi:pilus assembly protein Flp/PilA
MLRTTTSSPTPSPLSALAGDERGAQMVEYIILVGMVAILALAGFKTFGSTLREKVDQQADTVSVIQGTTP